MPGHESLEKSNNTVIIAGGGWSGLAAAVELTRQQVPVILLESAKQLGGRARSVHIDDLRVDNGQHMMIGAYESMLDLLRIIGVKENSVFLRQSLAFKWFKKGKRAISLKTPKLPAPLHLAWALINARGLSLSDRFSALKLSRQLEKMDFSLPEDCSVETLLKRYNQSTAVVESIWEPLCLGALNTRINEASAQIFLRTLRDSFTHRRSDSDLLLTRKDLGAIFPEPALDYIERHNGSVRLGQRVTDIQFSNESITGIKLDNEEIQSNYVILATPVATTKKIINNYLPLKHIKNQLEHIEHRPICTVYIQYPDSIRLHDWLRGSIGTTTQWIFDRRLYGQDGLMSIVISSDGKHMEWDNQQLCETIKNELATLFPGWPEPLSCHVIREKRATFASTVNINTFRPDTKTPVKGLWLAGDYTNNGLPGTLEGAIRSGIRCATEIIHDQKANLQ